MKIALYVPEWPAGRAANGIVTYASHLIPALRELGNEVFVVTPRCNEPDPYTIDLTKFSKPSQFWDGILFKVAPEAALFNAVTAPIISAIKYLVEKHQIDIFEMEETNGWVGALSKLDLIPVVTRLHGPWFLNKRSNGPKTRYDLLREKREGEGIATAQIVTSPSLDTLERTKQRYQIRQDSLCIQNSIAPASAKWSGATCDKDSLLFVGRFDEIKGGDLVIKAFGQLAAQNPNLKLTFIGPDDGINGIKLDAFARQALTPDALHRLKYLGPLPHSEIAAHRTQSFLTIAASLYEPFGYTVLEAMSFGCPIVASNVGGIPELIRDGESGLLFDPKIPGSLSSSIQAMLNDLPMAAKMGEKARQDSLAFYNIRQMAIYTAETYRQEIKKFPSRKATYVPDQHDYY